MYFLISEAVVVIVVVVVVVIVVVPERTMSFGHEKLGNKEKGDRRNMYWSVLRFRILLLFAKFLMFQIVRKESVCLSGSFQC